MIEAVTHAMPTALKVNKAMRIALEFPFTNEGSVQVSVLVGSCSVLLIITSSPTPSSLYGRFICPLACDSNAVISLNYFNFNFKSCVIKSYQNCRTVEKWKAD